MHDNEIKSLFDLLDKWRLFPAYQLERRADIFFALYMKEILENTLNCTVEKIIPEFPVRIGTIYPKVDINKSFKIDYLVVCKEEVLLIELKTDTSSRREKQDDYLKATKGANVTKLIDGLLKIYTATSSKTKYSRLLNELTEIGWLEKGNKTWKNKSKNKKIKIIYIQPIYSKAPESEVISFESIASILENKESQLAQRFAKSLRKWTEDPNKKQSSS